MQSTIMTENTQQQTNLEATEKMRQAVMRLRELMDLMQGHLDEAERAYAGLFAHIAPDVLSTTHEKENQRLAALRLLDNPQPLAHTVLDLQSHARTFEREFEALYGHIVTE